ncbi:uncharacterized protein C18orf19 homolog B-like [Gadus macrocephalus]|uniref:uncharacterized protein C18orf19 homolog B-like n=1 Tax=Gadus macrocephalus TaxID=80720 RepID=UPI0028CB3141|nr:uncharacterized protein C18orf19 homolog B-like [Gadus macrocephalus]
MMQRVLSHHVLRQVSAMRGRSVRFSGSERLGPLCCCVLLSPRLAAGSHRQLSVSVASRAVQHPKQQPSEEEAQPPPHTPAQAPQAVGAGEAGSAGSAGSAGPTLPGEESLEIDPLQDKSIGLIQRFKRTFKQYGKVMIPVHLVTSSIWLGTFYYAAMKGVNVVPFLELIGLPESIVGLLRNSSSGYALTAYAMYKIATPARYTVTLGGTSLSVQYLRRHGYFSTPPPVKDYIQDKMEETKEKLSEKMEVTKERLSEKMEETKEMFSGRMEETKERLSEKMEETKDKFSEKLQETKDKVSEGKTFFRKKVD